MAVKRRGLGKGIDSLIPNEKAKPVKNESAEEVNKENYVNINKIEPNRNQPRKLFNEDALQELADSIKVNGIIEPLVVVDRKDYYMIVSGERRWRAAKIAGLKEVPVVIRDYSEQEIVEISLIENIQRKDLNPIEEAQTYKRLLEEFNLKQDEVAERVGKNRTTITNSLRLLKLNEKVQQMIIDEKLSTGSARPLIAIEDPKLQFETAERIFDEKLNSREVEKLIKSIISPKVPKSKTEKTVNEALELAYAQLADRLKGYFGTKVSISNDGRGSGKIEIEFYSQDELDRITDLMEGKNVK